MCPMPAICMYVSALIYIYVYVYTPNPVSLVGQNPFLGANGHGQLQSRKLSWTNFPLGHGQSSHRCVNHIIMSIASSCQPHHEVSLTSSCQPHHRVPFTTSCQPHHQVVRNIYVVAVRLLHG